jgi:hypothetical protein
LGIEVQGVDRVQGRSGVRGGRVGVEKSRPIQSEAGGVRCLSAGALAWAAASAPRRQRGCRTRGGWLVFKPHRPSKGIKPPFWIFKKSSVQT